MRATRRGPRKEEDLRSVDDLVDDEGAGSATYLSVMLYSPNHCAACEEGTSSLKHDLAYA